MKVTGYVLREALRKWTTRLEVLKIRFGESVWAFAGETKDLAKAETDWKAAMENVAVIQCLQQRYNGLVQLHVAGRPMSLAAAVKLVGMVGQLDAAWRKAAVGTKKERWNDDGTTRSKDNEYAAKTMSQADLEKHSDAASSYAAALRAAIAAGNATEIDLGEVPEGVL